MNKIHHAPAATIPEMCFAALARHAKLDAVNHKQDERWVHTSAEEFAGRVRAVALGLSEALNIKKGDRIALLSENRPEWSIVDLAILSLGAVNVPIYTTQAPEQVRYILEDSGARLLFASGEKVYRHVQAAIAEVETLEKTIFFDAAHVAERSFAMTLGELERRGSDVERHDPERYQELVGAVGGGDLATIIYTSGTTGEPKGVMLTHRSFVSNVRAISGSLPISHTDVALSVLPLSHIFERTVFYVFCYSGVSVYYAASFDNVGEYLRDVRPTIMTAVPRLFEKVYHRIVKQGSSAAGLKRKIFFGRSSQGRPTPSWSIRANRFRRRFGPSS
ncbi:MAG: AMP-binding protein [Pyrinomonadaceae bacterium]